MRGEGLRSPSRASALVRGGGGAPPPVKKVGGMMDFELTTEQELFKSHVAEFARDVVAPRAAAIDKSGEYPADVIHAAAREGLLGVTIPKAWGGAGRDYVSYAL